MPCGDLSLRPRIEGPGHLGRIPRSVLGKHATITAIKFDVTAICARASYRRPEPIVS